MSLFQAPPVGVWTRLCAAISIAIVGTFITSVADAGCVRDYRDVYFSDGSARIRSYRCATDSARLRVEFHRLSEVATGSILLGQPLDSVQKCVGNPTLLKNDVYRELLLLYRRFGTREVRAGSDNGFYTQTKIDTPRGGVSYSNGNTTRDGWDIWDITQGQVFSIPNAIPITRRGNGPRLATTQEIHGISAYMRRACSAGQRFSCNKYPLMLSYMEEGTELPSDIALINHQPDDPKNSVVGGCVLGAYFVPRPVVATLVTLENENNSTVSIDHIFGDEINPRGRLKFRRGMLQYASRISSKKICGNVSIPPRSRVMLFLAISLGRTNGQIMANEKGIELSEYTYGPEVAISGFDLNGTRLALDEGSANYLEVSASPMGMSCPILYAFDDTRAEWHSYGKVIHEANGKSRELTQTIRLVGYSKSFRLMEEESERAFIDSVQLHVILNDGTQLDLKPNNSNLREQDSVYLERCLSL